MNIEFKDNVAHIEYKGADVEIRRYPGPDVWGWNWQHFISINGDSCNRHGRPYQYAAIALRVAKRLIDKGDFESSKLWLLSGSHSPDAPKCPKCGEKNFDVYHDDYWDKSLICNQCRAKEASV